MTETVVDCVGRPCPIPVIELARAVDRSEPGSVVVLLADDPAAAVDVAAWCRMKGHRLLSAEVAGGGQATTGGVVSAYRVECRAG